MEDMSGSYVNISETFFQPDEPLPPGYTAELASSFVPTYLAVNCKGLNTAKNLFLLFCDFTAGQIL
jgi:hypothetical protein